jgi:hypothetical protein
VAVLAGPDDDFSDEEEAFVPPPVEKESRGKRQKVGSRSVEDEEALALKLLQG